VAVSHTTKKGDTKMASEMAKRKCAKWLWEHDCEIGQYDGEDFVIAPCYSYVEKTKFFEGIVRVATGGRDNWGFADEYTLCSECGRNVIRTSPDSYCWQPDYWLGDGFIMCKECAQRNADDYIEAMTQHGGSVHAVNTDIADPADYGFKLVVEKCEYGLHEHMNDDPRAVAKWAKENDLCVAFIISNSQFDTEWDAWMRPVDGGELSDEEVQEIKDTLTEFNGYGFSLRREFRQWPTPADLCKQQLRQVDEMDACFAKVDTSGAGGLKVYPDFESLAADS
jgi:hypothetical protein